MVLRVEVELFVDGRRRPIRDGYRASLSFGRRRRGVEPIVHDAVLVLEDVDELAPGETGIARAYVFDELPRHVDDVFTFLEGDRMIARARLLEVLEDPTPQPLADLAAAKRRRL